MATSSNGIVKDGNRATIVPAGDIVAATLQDLRASLKEIVDGGVTEVIVDMKAVLMIDSTGIGLLVALCNSLAKQQGKLSVINCSKDITDLFKAMRLDRHFTISTAS